MTRTTSAKAFREETGNGNIPHKQYVVWDWLKLHGPATGRQISDMIPGGHKRLAELKAKDMVKELGHLTDGLTGKTAIIWDYKMPDELFWAREKTTKLTRKQLEDKFKGNGDGPRTRTKGHRCVPRVYE